MNALSRLESLDKLLPDLFRNFGRPLRTAAEDFPAEIRLDVSEGEKEYTVRAEVPGAKKDDIRVTVDGNYVSITCEVRKERQEKSQGRVLVQETTIGSASRGFSLAHEIDAGAVVAKLEDGVLQLTLPKRAGAHSRLITVQ